MDVPLALTIISAMTYRPEYTITATDATRRFKNAIIVRIEVETRNSGTLDQPDLWKDAYPVKVTAPAAFTLYLDDITTKTDLYRAIIQLILRVEEHEAREFLRDSATGIAPLHPHTMAGMLAWPTPSSEVTYGLDNLSGRKFEKVQS